MTTPRQCRSGFTRLQDNRRRRRRKKIEEESETDGAEREESSEGMCRLEFKFIVKKRKKHYWKLGWELSNQTKSYSVEMERESQKAWDSIGD